ncbi:MAG TPA: hypothetical protein VM938_12820 [Acidimicrobiales bacterium]|nr:hypothetical protein [Acidimicrobiales bacterium]
MPANADPSQHRHDYDRIDETALASAYLQGQDAGWDTLAKTDTSDTQRWLRATVGAVGSSRSDGGTWFSLVEALLLLVEDNQATWPPRANEHEDAAILIASLREAMADARSVWVGQEAAALIIDALDRFLAEYSEEERPGMALWAAQRLAHVIDEERQDTLSDWSAGQGRFVIEPRRAYPVARLDPRTWLGGSANTRPQRLPSAVPGDAVHNVHIGNDLHHHYRLTLDWTLQGVLTGLSGLDDLRITTLHPDGTVDDFIIEPGPEAGTVVNRGPVDPDAHAEVLTALLRKAADLEAHVVVLPEYAVPEATRTRLKEVLEELPNAPMLVVAGSTMTDEGFNEGSILVTAGDVCTSRAFRKVHRAEFQGQAEGIATDQPPSVTVWRAGDLALAVLLCRDAQDRRLMELLSDAGVNLLIVPSFTDRAESIIGVAERLSTTTQAFVIVAIGPRRLARSPGKATRETEAFFRGPYGDDTRPPAVYAPDSEHADERGDGPGLWLFSSRGRHAEWHGLD